MSIDDRQPAFFRLRGVDQHALHSVTFFIADMSTSQTRNERGLNDACRRFETDGIAGDATRLPSANSAGVARARGWGRRTGRHNGGPVVLQDLQRVAARGARAGGDAMPSAGAVSHRQQVMRIAINTGVLALIRPPSAGLADWYSVSVFQSAGLTEHLGGPSPASGWQSAREASRWHRPSSVAGGSAWTKLQGKSTTYSVTLVKQIIGGAASPASAQVKIVEVDEESAGQRLDNFLIRAAQGRAQDPCLPDHPQRRSAA